MLKAMIFIDGRNFESAVNNLYSLVTLIDYEKLTALLSSKLDHHIMRTYYYTGQGDKRREPTKFDQTQRFIDALNKKDNFIAKAGRLEYLGIDQNGKDIYTEKQTDVNIVTDLLYLAHNNAYDTAILLSADTDYIPVMNLIRQMGKKVITCSVEGQKHGIVKTQSDMNIELHKEDLDKIKK